MIRNSRFLIPGGVLLFFGAAFLAKNGRFWDRTTPSAREPRSGVVRATPEQLKEIPPEMAEMVILSRPIGSKPCVPIRMTGPADTPGPDDRILGKAAKTANSIESRPLYGCVFGKPGDSCPSLDQDRQCPGGAPDPSLPTVFVSPVLMPGMLPLYRCYDSQNRPYPTLDSRCEAGGDRVNDALGFIRMVIVP